MTAKSCIILENLVDYQCRQHKNEVEETQKRQQIRLRFATTDNKLKVPCIYLNSCSFWKNKRKKLLAQYLGVVASKSCIILEYVVDYPHRPCRNEVEEPEIPHFWKEALIKQTEIYHI